MHRFELGAVPPSERARALELQLRQASPFASTGHYVVPDAGDALVWLWDADEVARQLPMHGLRANSVSVAPESVLRPRHRDAVVLQGCLEGVEGQYWNGESLVASRWWPVAPSQAEWMRFQRDAGVDPARQADRVPAIMQSELLDAPWAPSVEGGNSSSTGSRETFVVLAGAVILALATIWYVATIVKLEQAAASRRADLATLERELEPVRAARGEALEAAARAHALVSLNTYPDPLTLMAAVSERLPSQGATLREWDFRDGKLRIVVVLSTPIASSEYVKALEGAGLFANVQAAPTPDASSLVVSMDVLPNVQLPPPAASRPSS